MKDFADDNFEFDESGRKLSKQIENTVGKGEIAHYKQFLVFLQCFQKACFPGASKSVIVLDWVNTNVHIPVLDENVFLGLLKSNFLPNNKFLDWSRLTAFADDKIVVNLKKKKNNRNLLWE